MKDKLILLKITLIASIAFMLSSCVLTSDNPLGDKEYAIDDPDLKGFWRTINEDEISYLAILKGEEGYLKLLSFGNEVTGVAEFRAFVSKIGEDQYLNIQYVGDFGMNFNFGKEYIFMHYFINNKNELVMSAFKEDFFKKAVKEGLIKGNVEKVKTSYGYSDRNVRIQASTDEIVNFIKKQDKKEFLESESNSYKISGL